MPERLNFLKKNENRFPKRHKSQPLLACPNAATHMPRFSNAVLACLKRAMLPRAPAFFFTPQDVELLVEQTGLERSTILHWAENLRWKSKSGLEVGDVEAFLRNIDTDQKVI